MAVNLYDIAIVDNRIAHASRHARICDWRIPLRL